MNLQQEYLSNVVQRGRVECWGWLGRLHNGYGILYDHGIQIRAHRIGYEILVESLLPGEIVQFGCENRACQNPGHWFGRSRSEELYLFRYLRKVDRRGLDECWPWIGKPDSFGYGKFGLGVGHTTRAHQYGYEHLVGPIPPPPNNVVRHTCDNPICNNPRHWLIGTLADNLHDSIERKRNQFGEAHYLAVLTDESVLSIRADYAQGIKIVELVSRYGASNGAIHAIVTNRTWKHLL